VSSLAPGEVFQASPWDAIDPTPFVLIMDVIPPSMRALPTTVDGGLCDPGAQFNGQPVTFGVVKFGEPARRVFRQHSGGDPAKGPASRRTGLNAATFACSSDSANQDYCPLGAGAVVRPMTRTDEARASRPVRRAPGYEHKHDLAASTAAKAKEVPWIRGR
jgi:hypothetical protein